MRIGLVVVATGKYQRFVPDLWASAQTFFLYGHDVDLLLLTDDWSEPDENLRVLHIEHLPWPGPTLRRYHSLLAYRDVALQYDYLFQCDADMRFVSPVSEEVLPSNGLVGTIHPGFWNKTPPHFSYERRYQSMAYIPFGSGDKYYAGGFQGGKALSFIHAAETIADWIDGDAQRGITAVWHDESHWNRYLFENPPSLELDPGYCYPESWQLPFIKRLVALDKNHAEMRA